MHEAKGHHVATRLITTGHNDEILEKIIWRYICHSARNLIIPYISCSSIGSISPLSSSDSSESEEEEGENGSGRCADGGTVLKNRPLGWLDDG